MNRYGLPLLLLLSALIVAAGVLAVIGGGPAPYAISSPALVDEAGHAASLDSIHGRLRVVGLLGGRCSSGCEGLLDRSARLQDDYPDRLTVVLLAGEVPVEGGRGRILHGDDAALRDLFASQLGFSSEDLEAMERGRIDLLAAFIDPADKVRGRYEVGRDGGPAEWERMEAEIGFRVSLAWRPLLHASLNAASTLLLFAGFVFVRKKNIGAHRACMLLTTLVSLVFLASYVQYHHHVGSMPFRGEGWVRPLYFTILLSHTVLAAIVPPLAATLLVLAARGRFDRHRRIARWTLPMWLYVSTTGVVIYLMLYVWFAPA